MDLVIDANILFAALIRKGATSDILFKYKLYAPEFIFEEFKKYKDYIKAKTSRSEEDFNELFDIFERNIILIPEEEFEKYLDKAAKISPDEKDVPYLGLAMKLNCAIWSNDKLLKEKQNTIKIYNTQEIMNLSE